MRMAVASRVRVLSSVPLGSFRLSTRCHASSPRMLDSCDRKLGPNEASHETFTCAVLPLAYCGSGVGPPGVMNPYSMFVLRKGMLSRMDASPARLKSPSECEALAPQVRIASGNR